MKQEEIPKTSCLKVLPAVNDAIYAIGGKWKLRIIIALSEGAVRFNELQRHLDGISARVLSGELKDLEQNGFVKRVVYPDASVEYKRTEYAETLKPVLASLHAWGTMHRQNIMQRSREQLVTEDKG